MHSTEPNQAIRNSVALSTALITVQILIIGVGVTGPA